MRYRDAIKLHNEDEVTVKKTGTVVRVLAISQEPGLVWLYCDDCTTYFHTEVK